MLGIAFQKPVSILSQMCFAMSRDRSSNNTRLLVPGYPSRQGTHMCIFTVENSRPLKARHTSCTYLLWKSCNQGGQGTVETSRRRKARHTYLRGYRGNLKNLCVLSYFTSGVPSERGDPNYVYVYVCM